MHIYELFKPTEWMAKIITKEKAIYGALRKGDVNYEEEGKYIHIKRLNHFKIIRGHMYLIMLGHNLEGLAFVTSQVALFLLSLPVFASVRHQLAVIRLVLGDHSLTRQLSLLVAGPELPMDRRLDR